MRANHQTALVLLQEVPHHVTAEHPRHSALVALPPVHVLHAARSVSYTLLMIELNTEKYSKMLE